MLILAREIPNPRLLVTVLMSLIGYLSRPDEPILPVQKKGINIVPSSCHFHGLHMFSYWPQLLPSQRMRNRSVIAKWSFFYTSLITHCESLWQYVSFSLTMKWLLFRQSSSWNGFTIDCKQPLFCFIFSERSLRLEKWVWQSRTFSHGHLHMSCASRSVD